MDLLFDLLLAGAEIYVESASKHPMGPFSKGGYGLGKGDGDGSARFCSDPVTAGIAPGFGYGYGKGYGCDGSYKPKSVRRVFRLGI